MGNTFKYLNAPPIKALLLEKIVSKMRKLTESNKIAPP